MDTVNESKVKPHRTFKDSESIHLNNSTYTDMLFTPTSMKANIAAIVVSKTEVQVTICEPVTPIFLPRNDEVIEANKGNINIDRYII